MQCSQSTVNIEKAQNFSSMPATLHQANGEVKFVNGLEIGTNEPQVLKIKWASGPKYWAQPLLASS